MIDKNKELVKSIYPHAMPVKMLNHRVSIINTDRCDIERFLSGEWVFEHNAWHEVASQLKREMLKKLES